MAKKKETKPPAKQTQTKQPPAQKRPSTNSPIPPEVFVSVGRLLNQIKSELEPYAAHLRPLDRKRLNKVGLKKQGFIERSYEYIRESPQFLPHYLTRERVRVDHEYSVSVRVLYDGAKQIDEILLNINALAANADYTNSLDYYASAREAAKRRVDGAETIYNDLEIFFKHKKIEDGKPTAKKVKHDLNALSHNKRDGVIVVENVKPKLTGGKHKVID